MNSKWRGSVVNRFGAPSVTSEPAAGSFLTHRCPSAWYATRSPFGDTRTSRSAFTWNLSGATATGKRTASCTERVVATWNGTSVAPCVRTSTRRILPRAHSTISPSSGVQAIVG
jgi:hypothetical protein